MLIHHSSLHAHITHHYMFTLLMKDNIKNITSVLQFITALNTKHISGIKQSCFTQCIHNSLSAVSLHVLNKKKIKHIVSIWQSPVNIIFILFCLAVTCIFMKLLFTLLSHVYSWSYCSHTANTHSTIFISGCALSWKVNKKSRKVAIRTISRLHV